MQTNAGNNMKPPLYLDYNATTPIDPAVAKAMTPFLYGDMFGNPSSSHYYGVRAKEEVERARSAVAKCVGSNVDEIVFTSGGSESNNYAIKGVVEWNLKHNSRFATARCCPHVITSVIEHPATLEVCRFLEEAGMATVSYVPVDGKGFISVADVANAITDDTVLITVMHSNNETGALQPISEIGNVIRSATGIVFHTDASQSIGKVRIDVSELQVDMLTITSHKFYGPKGVGALYIRNGSTILMKQIHGAGHERNLRAGTENVMEIVGLGKACSLVTERIDEDVNRMKEIRNTFWSMLLENLSPSIVKANTDLDRCLCNTLSVRFCGLHADMLLTELEDCIAASAGAACHSDDVSISYVLQAMQIPDDEAVGTVRFSIGRGTTREDVVSVVPEICNAVRRLSVLANKQDVDEECPVLEQGGDVRLTNASSGLGCGCKLSPGLLSEVLRDMPQTADENVLVGHSTADDAGVYKMSAELALVQTLDFFTPIVDDPHTFGRIAAANALSDVYAMGGIPVTALNIVSFPSQRYHPSILKSILLGARAVCDEAGVAVLGGHSVDDPTLKFGMQVTGTVHPDRVWRNNTVEDGDVLIITKPIGTGLACTALKRRCCPGDLETAAIEAMTTLNKGAAESLLQSGIPVHACTDITGFGLLGHACEMVESTDFSIILSAESVPFLPQVEKLAMMEQCLPGGTKANCRHFLNKVSIDNNVSTVQQNLLFDPQTAGGLLIAVPATAAADTLELLKPIARQTAQVGCVVRRNPQGAHVNVVKRTSS